ncbi:MAG: hypothetical protein JNJ53_05440 [Rhizobiales bacterium]|nr:hypothetical protein [Hyphomicrobiales bacterium]
MPGTDSYAAIVADHCETLPEEHPGTAEAIALLRRESEIREGAPPARLADAIERTASYEISPEAFLLRVPNGLVLHYRRGEGVTTSRPAAVAESEIALFLNGSVYGAIAWINGFFPLHASAVVYDGKIHAFTGPSGYGKSTLAAALGQRGMALFADDVLVLDLSDPHQIICLPGHKQLKLWEDALALTGTQPGAAVRERLSKFYVKPTGGVQNEARALQHLTILRAQARYPQGPVALKGADRLSALHAAFYRRKFCAAIMEHRASFAALAKVGAMVPMSVFDRPLDKDLFDTGVDMMVEAIKSNV